MLSLDEFSTAQRRLAAGLRPDLLGSLNAPPEPLAAIGGGVLLLRSREGSGGKREGRVGKRKERKIEWRG